MFRIVAADSCSRDFRDRVREPTGSPVATYNRIAAVRSSRLLSSNTKSRAFRIDADAEQEQTRILCGEK